MGLFSSFKQQAVKVPSLTDQQKFATKSVNAFIDAVYETFDKEGDADYSTAKFSIAGITYRCDYSDVGMIRGVTFVDSKNTKDKTAIGILSIDNSGRQRLLGYIPKDSKEEYSEFSEGSSMLPFIGYITKFQSESGESGIMGRIKIYYGGGSKKQYLEMVEDTMLITGAFKEYYQEQTLKEAGFEVNDVLEMIFYR